MSFFALVDGRLGDVHADRTFQFPLEFPELLSPSGTQLSVDARRRRWRSQRRRRLNDDDGEVAHLGLDLGDGLVQSGDPLAVAGVDLPVDIKKQHLNSIFTLLFNYCQGRNIGTVAARMASFCPSYSNLDKNIC